MRRTDYVLYSDGIIAKIEHDSWFKGFIKTVFLNKSDENITLYVPKKLYSLTEETKLSRLLRRNSNLDNKDMAILVNAIRPNTFKETIEDVVTSKYYFDATTKEDIRLLKSGKQI